MAGTLVVTSKKASIPEIGGDNVIYCDPLTIGNLADCLAKASRMASEEKNKIQDTAQSRAAQFTWQKSADETMQILQNIAGKRLI